jgi:hypothetical protein
LRHYTVQQMGRTPQAKWIGIQYALFIGCSLFGVAYYFPFAVASVLRQEADRARDGGRRPAVAGQGGGGTASGCVDRPFQDRGG